MNLEQYLGQHQWNKMQEVAGNEDINLSNFEKSIANLYETKYRSNNQFEANK